MQELGEDVSAAMSVGAAKASSIFQHSLSSLKLGSLTSSLKRSAAKEPAAGAPHRNQVPVAPQTSS